jgi:hypothetical protein
VSDRPFVPPSRASARNGRDRDEGTKGRGPPHDDSTPPAEELMTREQWIAYHVARAPKITQRQWAEMLLLLHYYGNQETSDDEEEA